MALYSTTAYYADGRMIEQTWATRSLHEALAQMRKLHPQAMEIDGEYLMDASDYQVS